jgi:phage gpG-like protein
MSIAFNSTDDSAEMALEGLERRWESQIRPRCQLAGAEAFRVLVLNNFGHDHHPNDRPVQWKDLNPKYAKRKHGGDVDPTLILTGLLKNSVQIESRPEYAEVYTNVDYATAHQQGGEHLPARPFFPMDESGNPTEFAREQIFNAIEAELEAALNE